MSNSEDGRVRREWNKILYIVGGRCEGLCHSHVVSAGDAGTPSRPREFPEGKECCCPDGDEVHGESAVQKTS